MDQQANDAKAPLSPRTQAVLALIQGLLPALTGIVGGIWIALTYVENQKQSAAAQIEQARRENMTRLFEARKPFMAEQLARYVETAKVTGKLVSTNDFTSGDWDETFRRFEQLYWTELSMVEDETVKARMQNFYKHLIRINANKSAVQAADIEKLRELSYVLARALRSGIEATWEVNLSKESR